jgi:hypothetical protein
MEGFSLARIPPGDHASNPFDASPNLFGAMRKNKNKMSVANGRFFSCKDTFRRSHEKLYQLFFMSVGNHA